MAKPKLTSPENCLYYGDNLDVLRRYVKDESVDLVYLDPPFIDRGTPLGSDRGATFRAAARSLQGVPFPSAPFPRPM